MTIFIATHKPYKMPQSDNYQPIFVGAAQHESIPIGYQSDASGKNISKKILTLMN
ncbi:hypothetical protein GCM10025879_18020 [Leuconostoc litchii]|nr:hypothetical protein GCM10025879_18020 [Leuconostoc litchii]